MRWIASGATARIAHHAAALFVAAAAAAACDPGTRICEAGEERVSGECVGPRVVKLNTVGFLPQRAKRATTAAQGTTFSVRRADGTVAHEGTLEGPMEGDTGETLFVADFTELTEAGEFVLEVAGAGASPPFQIAGDVFVHALRTAMLGLHGQRCGGAVDFQHDGEQFGHPECHTGDALLDYAHAMGAASRKPSVGGWHDAGDYGKYTINGAFSAGVVLKAWEHFTPALAAVTLPIQGHAGPLPDVLAEVKWELDWLLTASFDDGSVSHKVTARNFEPLDTDPDQDAQPRYFAPAGTAATADFVAVMALAARVYRPYDESVAAAYLEAAERSYAYLAAHPDDQAPDLAVFHTGNYETSDDDDRLWAAAELWETTGTGAALADVEARSAGAAVSSEWDWANVRNLGLFTYVLSERSGRSAAVLEGVRDSVLAVADAMTEQAAAHAYGRGIGARYYWGINGIVARSTMNLWVAHRLQPEARYLDAAVQQADHVLGRNHYGRSQVTGVGYHPPRAPHHRPSIADRVSAPWPGLLVGGSWPDATSWVDSQNEYETNEVAVNWNAALVYALAGFLPSESETP